MKNKLMVLAALSLSALTGPALAGCPASLTAEQKLECIVTINAGYAYPEQNNTVTSQSLNTDTEKTSQSLFMSARNTVTSSN